MAGAMNAAKAATKDNGAVNVAELQPTREVPANLQKSVNAAGILDEALSDLGVDSDAAFEETDDDSEIEIPGEESAAEEAAPEEKPADDAKPEEKPAEKAEANPDVEEVTANGETVRIDYNDRAAYKRWVEKAAGVDKLFARYSELKSELATAKKGRSDKEELFDTFSSKFGEGDDAGYLALIDHLSKGKGAEVVARLAGKPAPTAAAPAADAKPSEVEALRAEVTSLKQETKLERAQAAVDGVFPSYSYSGKLGDAESENQLDAEMFAEFQARMTAAEAKGTPITHDSAKVIMESIHSAKNKAIHLAATKLMSRNDSAATKAAKAAVQAAAIGKGGAGSGGKKAKPNENINWTNPKDITQFLEDSLG